MTQFIAIDGEGRNNAKHGHDYYLLCASDGTYIESNGPLGLIEILQFIDKIKLQYPNAAIVGYGLSYDFTKWFEDLLKEGYIDALRTLHANKSIKVNDYRLRLIEHKWLEINDVRIWDVISFFQSSFTKALTDWKIASATVIDEIAQMKAKRGHFETVDVNLIRSYCISECEQLVRLMNALESAFGPLRLKLTHWHGPGAVADAMLKKHNVAKLYWKKNRDKPQYEESDFNHIFRSGYHGGRFEISRIGEIGGPIHSYDINSAYPYAITKLPCLKHSKWRWDCGRHIYDIHSHQIAIYRLEWHQPDDTIYGAFPFRFRNGSKIYPTHGRGWYWCYEVDSALKMPGVQIKFRECLWLEQNCNHVPFSWIHDLYKIRQRFKKEGNLAHLSLRLAYNSLYGKFAEKDHNDGYIPFWQTYSWAGMITSMCRAQILDAINDDVFFDPDSILAIATDGILSTKQRNLPCSNDLGEWEYETHDSVFLAQSGIYRLKDGLNNIIKARGASDHNLPWNEIETAWCAMSSAARIPYKTTQFFAIGASLMRKDVKRYYGKWLSVKKEICLEQHGRYALMRLENEPIPTAGDSTFAWSQRLPHYDSAPYKAMMEFEEDLDYAM